MEIVYCGYLQLSIFVIAIKKSIGMLVKTHKPKNMNLKLTQVRKTSSVSFTFGMAIHVSTKGLCHVKCPMTKGLRMAGSS